MLKFLGLESDKPKPPPIGERVADAAALPEGGRLQVKLAGRYITLLRLGGRLSCIDSICFHAGGPLGLGDIEEVNGESCLVCPWHQYMFDVTTGERVYQKTVLVGGNFVKGDWASNGVRQRTHAVAEKDGGLFVRLATHPLRVDSDEFTCKPQCGDRVLAARLH